MKRVGLVLLSIATQLTAQAPGQALAAPNGRLNGEFSDLTTIRELVDGRVLLYDRMEERLLVGDFPSGSAYDVARKGRGPSEFEFIATLLALPGDTTIAADQNRRWLILVGDSVVHKLLPEHPALQRIWLAPLGADRSAHVLSRAFGRDDSSSAILVHRVSGLTDTIARLAYDGRRAAVRGTATIPGLGTAPVIGRMPLRWEEMPILFVDGWVAVVRINPYRVDWRAPGGKWTLGRPIPVRKVRATDAEKAAYVRRKPGLRNATEWPEDFPAFETPVTLLASPEGHLLVKRLPTMAEPGTRYDVIDRAGNRVTQIVLDEKEQILGFGARSVYVFTTDDDGIQRLRRHPWPASQRP